jgi:hypothetical protein
MDRPEVEQVLANWIEGGKGSRNRGWKRVQEPMMENATTVPGPFSWPAHRLPAGIRHQCHCWVWAVEGDLRRRLWSTVSEFSDRLGGLRGSEDTRFRRRQRA